MKRFSVRIVDHETEELTEFSTNAMLGAFINRELEGGGSDTSQFLLGSLSEKELIKLLAGCINMMYFASNGDIKQAEKFIGLSSMVAKKGYEEMMEKKNYRRGL